MTDLLDPEPADSLRYWGMEDEGSRDSTPISLLERLRQPRQEAAWERFVQLYTPLLCHWAHKLGLEGQDAADLIQDVFTLLVQKLAEFRYDPGKRFRGWLWTLTRNCCRERLRRQQVPVQPGAPELLSQAATPGVAEEVAEEEYRQYLTRRAMQLMQAEFEQPTWTAFWESVVNERPAAAVAEELGLSENAVYLAKGRVLRRLREELAGLLD
jgi:RNA polymerase sigma-70 factor (ECF subfamily)